MPRRPLGRGRRLAVIASALMLVGCLLPWYGVGGGSDLPAIDLRAFDGSGILVFFAALLTLALITLPYAMGDRPVPADAWPLYVLFTALALIGLIAWPIQAITMTLPLDGMLPTRAPGLWIALIGVLVHARATFEIHQDPPIR
jgi:hypothetical protein